MKIFFVIMIFGRIIQTIGPVPYNMDECRARIAEKSAELDRTFASKNLASDDRMIVDGRRVTRADVTLDCIASNNRPQLHE